MTRRQATAAVTTARRLRAKPKPQPLMVMLRGDVLSILGLRTWNEANEHCYWRKRRERVATQRSLTTLALNTHVRTRPALPVVVTLTRISPGMMDDDGAITALKSVRDAVAAWLGVDDGPRETRVDWRYAPQKRDKVHGVEIQISARSET